TFIVGVYGMNFNQMPELRWKYGYPAVWIFMVLFTFATLIYFKYRKWT
ncbi:MAG: magnesium transporter CorA, partial [Saprospiraceae bacterium]|nr:magnesium transporter CorA [Saprospiraceae bacterium]